MKGKQIVDAQEADIRERLERQAAEERGFSLIEMDSWRILAFLNDNYRGSRPLDGHSGNAMSAKLEIPKERVYAAVSDLEWRGLVITGAASFEDKAGFVAILPMGRDRVRKTRGYKEHRIADRKRRTRSILTRGLWEVVKILLAAFLAALFLKLLKQA